MCLVTTQEKAKITKKDIIVYKQLSINKEHDDGIRYMSPYRNAMYHKKQLNTVTLSMEKRTVMPRDCFDDYVTIKYDVFGSFDITKKEYTVVSVGFHSALTYYRLYKMYANEQRDRIYPIRRFLIPRGSQVFYNATGLIVSNQIIML